MAADKSIDTSAQTAVAAGDARKAPEVGAGSTPTSAGAPSKRLLRSLTGLLQPYLRELTADRQLTVWALAGVIGVLVA